MSEPRHVRSTSGPDRPGIGRRKFLRNMTVFSLTALAGSSLLAGCSPATATPTASPTALPQAEPTAGPVPASPASLLEALRQRKSASAFQTQPLPKQKLLDLLWAAWGINRPDSGKRTAPSAMNSQEIDIYVLLAEGAYVYDAQANQLTPVSDQDLRSKAGVRGFMQDAPAHLLFVADYARFRGIAQSEKELFSAAHTGFIGQNVYLYCASEGLAARFYAGLDRAALKGSLKLREDQAVVFAQAVGYPGA